MTVIEMSTAPGNGHEDLLYIDELTGIYNRRFYTRRFAEEAERATKGACPLAMALVDVDYFKSVNDSYGHQEGDRLLRQVGETMKKRCVEPGALPIRYGGDEFIILVPGATRDAAVELMERVCDDVRGMKVETARSGLVSVTLSVGVASYKEDCETPEELFHAADRAVYRAKEDGRNRVCVPPSAEVVLFSRNDFHRLFPCPRLIGRHDVLNEVKKHLRLGTEIQRPVVVLEGPSGVGKSRLLDTMKSLMDAQRSFLLHARGQPYLLNQPYGVIVDALRIAIRSDAHLAQRIGAHLSAAEIGAISPLIPDVAGLHLVAPDDSSPRVTGRQLITSAILKMLASAADGKPLNVIVDDLHWADAGTVEVLGRLKGTEIGKSALVLVAMRKTGEVVGDTNRAVLDFVVAAAPNRVLLPVEPMSYMEVREMMAAILPGLERNNRLVQVVSHKSQALPLLVEEILKFLIQRGTIESKDGQVVVNEFNDSDIPNKINDILQQRAMTLDEEVRTMVSAASVVGASFDLGVLQALDERNEGELLGAIDKGVRTSIISAESPDEFRFTSDEARQVIYDQVDEAVKTELHEKVAAIEEKRAEGKGDASLGRLAYHYQKAGKQDRAINLFRKLQKDYEQQPAAVAGTPPPPVIPEFVQQISLQLDVQVRDLESGDSEKVATAVVAIISSAERAVDPLINLVLSSDDLRARRLALQCLHRVTKGVVQRLLEELYRTQNYEEKCRLIASLGEYQNPKIVNELAPYVRYPDSAVRRETLRVMEKRPELIAVEVMRAAMSDENEEVAQDAIAALGRLGRAEIVPDLLRLVAKRTVFTPPRRKAVQREACVALGNIGHRDAVPILIKALQRSPFYTFLRNKIPEVRAAAAMSLASFQGDDIRNELEKATHDGNEIVRSAAKMALVKIRGGLLIEDPAAYEDALPSVEPVEK